MASEKKHTKKRKTKRAHEEGFHFHVMMSLSRSTVPCSPVTPRPTFLRGIEYVGYSKSSSGFKSSLELHASVTLMDDETST